MRYQTDHLDDNEVKAIMHAVWSDFKLQFSEGKPENSELLGDYDELSDEYQFWATEYENRREYDAKADETF